MSGENPGCAYADGSSAPGSDMWMPAAREIFVVCPVGTNLIRSHRNVEESTP